MAYSDPINMPVVGSIPAKVLARLPSAKPTTTGLYRTVDGAFTLQTRQNSTKNRLRKELVLTQFKVASDPLSTNNVEVSASVSLVFDHPKWGFTTAELKDMESALRAWVAGDATVRDRILNGEL